LSLNLIPALLVAVVPVLLFLAVLIYLDSYKLLRFQILLETLLVGGGAGLGGFLVNASLLSTEFIGMSTYTRYCSPFVEETLKALFLIYLIRANRLGFLVDAGICGFAVGSGFAVVENLYYLFSVPSAGPVAWIIRGYGTAVMHGGCSAIFAIIAKLMWRKQGSWQAFVPPLLAVIAIHSFFNHFFLSPVLSAIVIVLPDETSESILEGFRLGTVPPRYQGGIGQSGVRNLEAFVRNGGTLVCLNRSSDFAISALHLPVASVVADLTQDEFYSSGSILEVTVDSGHPVMAGMPSRARVFFEESPVFTTLEEFQGVALAKYRAEGSSLLSGYLQGEERLRGFAAALDVYLGKGHVLLIGFRPQWRGQPFGTFRILFNAAFFSGELAAGGYSASDFWKPPAPPAGKKDDQANGNTPDSGH